MAGSHESVINTDGRRILLPSTDTIREFRQKRWINNGSPHWWSANYRPDPRELMPYQKFREHIVHVGKYQPSPWDFSGNFTKHNYSKDIDLYIGDKVPMSIIHLPIGGNMLPFMVTARPFNEKEIPHFGSFNIQEQIQKLKKSITDGKDIDLNDHYLPHIRGLVSEIRANHVFWYSMRSNNGLYTEVQNTLGKTNTANNLRIYTGTLEGDGRTYSEVYEELTRDQGLITKNPFLPDLSYDMVSPREFVEDYYKDDKNVQMHYPCDIKDIDHTLPAVVSCVNYLDDHQKHPTVLGVYASSNSTKGYGKNGIWMVQNPKLAQEISNKITHELSMPVNTILYIPQKGKPKYEKVPPQ